MTAKVVYLEHYLDSLETLPAELRRNFKLLRDLDTRAHDELQKVDLISADFLKNIDTLTPSRKAEEMAEVKRLFKKASDYADDKVELAMQTYEMVDKHIRKLDADLARFEADLKEKGLNPELMNAEAALKKKRRKILAKLMKKNKQAVSHADETPKSVHRKLKVPTVSRPETGALPATPLPTINHPSDVLDMPVDPNEPTYCFCHQVSYGEMIGCDNPDCPIEWFHFACVGLTSKPKGKWYCSNCSTDRKKK